MYSVQKLINKNNLKNICLLGLTSALLLNAKILGIIPFFVFLLMYTIHIFEKNKNKYQNIKNLILFFFFTFSFIFILWPYLWISPIENLKSAFLNIISAHESVSILTFFSGEHITSTNTPWNYRIIWFLITTPVIVTLLFSLGYLLILKKIITKILNLDENNKTLWNNSFEFFDFYLFFVIVATLFLTIKFNDSQYGGWRHLYFLYVAVILIFTHSCKYFYDLKNKSLKLVASSLILFTILYNTLWIYKSHPYHNNYFNILNVNYAKNNFDLDYWGLSNLHAIKYILNSDKRKKINIGTVSFADLKVSILKLNSEDKNDLEIPAFLRRQTN